MIVFYDQKCAKWALPRVSVRLVCPMIMNQVLHSSANPKPTVETKENAQFGQFTVHFLGKYYKNDTKTEAKCALFSLFFTFSLK